MNTSWAKLRPWAASLKHWGDLWLAPETNWSELGARIRSIERNIGLVVRLVVLLVVAYYLFAAIRVEDVTHTSSFAGPAVQRWAETMSAIQTLFIAYIAANITAGVLLIGMNQLPLSIMVWTVFAIGIFDGVFIGALTLVTGGFDSILFWVLLGLIVHNAAVMPLTPLQIVMNLLVSLCYLLAGAVDVWVTEFEAGLIDPLDPVGLNTVADPGAAEPFLLRVMLLLLMTACCYGVQVLLEKQRRARDEAHEFALRQHQLQSAGRLAGEIAHQLKNPLGIINNAAFSIQRTAKDNQGAITQHLQIIREEVERSDRIITELMDYARLAEGKVEKLNVLEELDLALERVFPAAAGYDVVIERDYPISLPPLVVQRSHFSEIFVNLLQNAREAMHGHGRLRVSAALGPDLSVHVSVRDTGPGIAPEVVAHIFEPYYTTKEKGTGLGLAIVKHNVELYGGRIRVESELGKGTEFILDFPARSLLKLCK